MDPRERTKWKVCRHQPVPHASVISKEHRTGWDWRARQLIGHARTARGHGRPVPEPGLRAQRRMSLRAAAAAQPLTAIAAHRARSVGSVARLLVWPGVLEAGNFITKAGWEEGKNHSKVQ